MPKTDLFTTGYVKTALWRMSFITILLTNISLIYSTHVAKEGLGVGAPKIVLSSKNLTKYHFLQLSVYDIHSDVRSCPLPNLFFPLQNESLSHKKSGLLCV